MTERVLLHICNYATPYKGSFIASLEHLCEERSVKNIYLFPHRAIANHAEQWIATLNRNGSTAYIQPSGFWATFFLLRRIIKMHRPDCVLTHFLDRRMDIMLFFLFKNHQVIRFFCSYVKMNRFKHLIACVLWSRNTLVGISKPLTDLLKLNYKGFRCATIENAVDFERLNKAGCLLSSLSSNPVRLLCMGYDINVKGTDLAIMAAARLHKIKQNIQLRIIAISEIQKCKIKEFIGSQGIDSDWIEILPPTQNIARYYNDNDIFLSPSRSEAFGNAVVEAAYSGNAVVASRVGGQAALEIDGAYWFDCGDLDGLYSQLERAVNEFDYSAAIERRKNAADHVSKKYAWEKWCDDVLRLVEAAIS